MEEQKKEYLFMPEPAYEVIRWCFVLTPLVTLLITGIVSSFGQLEISGVIGNIGMAFEAFFTSLHMVAKKVTDIKNEE